MDQTGLKISFKKEWLLPVYRPILFSEKRYIILYGGRDSGKSYAMAQKVLIDLMTKKYERTVLLRKIYRDIKDSQFQTLRDIIVKERLEEFFKITVSPLKIICLLNKNFIIARGLDKPDTMKSISSPTKIWYEEADQITQEDFLKSSQSLRSSNGAKLQELISFNPENEEENWISKMFFPPKNTYEKIDGVFHEVNSINENALIIHSTYKDNEYCGKERVDILESLIQYAQDLYRIYVLGLWGGALKGIIYDKYALADRFPEECKWVIYGLDFGYTNDPTALVKVGLKEGELYYEEMLYKTSLTNQDISEHLKALGLKNTDEIICDSAEPKSIEELRRLGWRVFGAEKGPDSVKNGIGLLKSYPMMIIKGSTNMLYERSKYKWRENQAIPEGQAGHFENKPIDMFNHILDAARYAVTYKIKKPLFWVR